MPDHELMEQLDRAIDAMLAGAEQMDSESSDPTLLRLTEIAGRLRDLPDDRFKSRLGLELQSKFHRRPQMSTSTSTFAAIETVTPFICVADGDKLIEFMKHTFGAEEMNRHAHGPDGFVASVRIVDSDLLVMADQNLLGQESPAALHVYVKDCDATYQRALSAGATTLGTGFGEPADRPYGERAGFVSDPFGNYWFIATRFGAEYVGTGLRHVTPSMLPSSAHVRPLIDFLGRAFGAEVEAHEVAGRVAHAFVHIGSAMMELAEADEAGRRPSGFYLHTDDVDAVYHSAVAAGGVSILPPADQPFGDRLAIVQDPAGNRWFAAKRLTNG